MSAATIERPKAEVPLAAPLDAIGLVAPPLHPDVLHAVAGLHLRLDLSDRADVVVARLESACPALILIDTDLMGCPQDVCRLARSLRPDVRVVAMTYYWSDREEGLERCVDGILHKPARSREWSGTLIRLGVPELLTCG